MALVMTPIFTQTVGSGGAATVTFNNIPQIYTDLLVLCSMRTDWPSNAVDAPWVKFNGSSTSPTDTRLFGTGSSVISNRDAWTLANAPTSTSNTFSNTSFYIPNYTGSNFKSFSIDSVVENNATLGYPSIQAGLWSSTAAITSIEFNLAVTGRNFVQYSTFSLYGIIRSGA